MMGYYLDRGIDVIQWIVIVVMILRVRALERAMWEDDDGDA